MAKIHARLAHMGIYVKDRDMMERFYTEVLGLRVGERPDFGFPGRWLYAGNGAAIVHLFAADDEAARCFTGSAADQGAGAVAPHRVARQWWVVALLRNSL